MYAIRSYYDSGVQGIQDQTEDFTEPAPGPNCTLSVNYFNNTDAFKSYNFV